MVIKKEKDISTFQVLTRELVHIVQGNWYMQGCVPMVTCKVIRGKHYIHISQPKQLKSINCLQPARTNVLIETRSMQLA